MADEPTFCNGHAETDALRTGRFARPQLARRTLPRRAANRAAQADAGCFSYGRAISRTCLFLGLLAAIGGIGSWMAESPTASAAVCAEKKAAAAAASLQSPADAQAGAEEELPRSARIDVPAVQQNPELPTGCESVALTNALLSLGFDLETTEIADAWLPTSSTDFVNAFLGDPRTADGHSCMAPAIVQAAASYLAANGSNLKAADMTGAALEDVLQEVAAGNPVIVWCTIDLQDAGTPYATASQDGRTYHLFANSHCVVLSGYDLDAGTVTASDSLVGSVEYDLETFATRYFQLGSQAVLIA